MSTIDTMATNVLAHLVREAGTSEHWTTPQIFEIINFLYRLLADDFRNVISTITEVDLTEQTDHTYLLPEKLLSVNEVLYEDEGIDPISIYEIKMMDTKWRSATGVPDWYCLDYIIGFLLLWRIPSATAPSIDVIGPTIPDALTTGLSPSPPYKTGTILEPGAVSVALSQEGPGQNLERSAYWYDIFSGAVESLNKSKTPSQDHSLRSIDEARGRRFGPRLPSSYPVYPWRGR